MLSPFDAAFCRIQRTVLPAPRSCTIVFALEPQRPDGLQMRRQNFVCVPQTATASPAFVPPRT